MIIRWNAFGEDVTDLPALWSGDDCEVCATNFHHPTITEGQHTNGLPSFWIRPIGGEWIRTLCRSFSTLRREWRVNQFRNLKPVESVL